MGPIGHLEHILKSTMGFWIDTSTSSFERNVHWPFLFLELEATASGKTGGKTEIRRKLIFIASINFSSQITVVTSVKAIFKEVATALDDLQSDSSMRCSVDLKLAADFKLWIGKGLDEIQRLFCEVD